MKQSILEEITKLEESLWIAEFRFDRVYMDQIFASDFFEFGKSGRIYSREEILPINDEAFDINATIPLPKFKVRYLSDEVIQTTYVSEITHDGVVTRANRSSVWSRVDGHWQLRFHQGTPDQSHSQKRTPC